MTLRVVADSGNIIPLPIGNYQDIAGMARRFADELGTDTVRVMLAIETEDGLRVEYWGQEATAYEMMGILEAAKLRVFADDAVGDEED